MVLSPNSAGVRFESVDVELGALIVLTLAVTDVAKGMEHTAGTDPGIRSNAQTFPSIMTYRKDFISNSVTMLRPSSNVDDATLYSSFNQ